MEAPKPGGASLPLGTASSGDLAFAVFLLLTICSIAWLGRLIYIEGKRKKEASQKTPAPAQALAQAAVPRSAQADQPNLLRRALAAFTFTFSFTRAARAARPARPANSTAKPTAAKQTPLPARRGNPTPTDIAFLALLALVLVSVVWVGGLIYKEGLKNEVSKQNAHKWTTWFTEASAKRFEADYDLADCAGGPRDKASPALWGKCLAALTADDGPLALLRNPFTKKLPALAAKCDPGNKSLAGALVIEKLVPTPPGSPQPIAASPMVESDPIDQKMQLRVSYCDMGAFPGKPAETEF